MSEIDTAAIRAANGIKSLSTTWCELTIEDLCDALDEARAEAKSDHGKWRCQWGSRWRDRAEAAEENLTFAQQRAADNGLRAQIGEEKIAALVAEIRDHKARIAAALNLMDNAPFACYRTGDVADERCHREGCAYPDPNYDEVRRALTGDTE